jgi:hypothetical protein
MSLLTNPHGVMSKVNGTLTQNQFGTGIGIDVMLMLLMKIVHEIEQSITSVQTPVLAWKFRGKGWKRGPVTLYFCTPKAALLRQPVISRRSFGVRIEP